MLLVDFFCLTQLDEFIILSASRWQLVDLQGCCFEPHPSNKDFLSQKSYLVDSIDTKFLFSWLVSKRIFLIDMVENVEPLH